MTGDVESSVPTPKGDDDARAAVTDSVTDPSELRPKIDSIDSKDENGSGVDSREVETLLRGDIQATDPGVNSAVRPSAPTLDGGPQKPQPAADVVIRTPPPPPMGFGPVSTTTPTGRDPSLPSSGKLRGLIGATLGRYEISEELGHGGMATVYRAHDPRLGRDVALKVIHAHLRESPEIAERFRHEARAAAKLKHRSIVEIYDVPDTDDGERFLVAELVDGPSLRKWLQTAQKEGGGGVMPPEIAGCLMLQVLGALSAAHAQGIVHRDVKPENILIAGLVTPLSSRPSDPASRALPVAKLTDFGIAKLLDAVSMTSTGQILGSPAHMAPEQIEGGDVTERVDVFACGVLFYELLTGQLPFDGKNPAQVIRRVLEGQFIAADRLLPTVGGRWTSIVAQLLAREPEKRSRSTDEVAAIVRRELEAMGVTDYDRELAAYLRAPSSVVSGWGERVKSLLVARAAKSRAEGDVIGAAADLNRALAYDPSDPRLIRAATSIRARERRGRYVKRGLPIVVGGLAIVVGTFFGVRWLRDRSVVAPPSSSSNGTIVPDTRPSTSTSAPSPSTSTTVAPRPSTSTSNTAIVPLVTTTTGTGSATPPEKATRLVRFNMFPAGTFTLDGNGPFDPLEYGERALTLGEHDITATGQLSCCEAYSRRIKIVEGEGATLVDIHLTFKPARVFVNNPPDGVVVTITVKTKDGAVLATGPAPLSVPVSKASVPVTIVLEVPGAPPKSVEAVLNPADAKYVDP